MKRDPGKARDVEMEQACDTELDAVVTSSAFRFNFELTEGNNQEKNFNVTYILPDMREEISYFDFLPDELMLRIFEYLDISALISVSETCYRMFALSYDTSMWNRLAIQNNLPLNKPRQFYVSLINVLLESKRNTIRHERHEKALKRANFILSILTCKLWEWMYSFLLVYSIFIGGLNLDRKIDMNWLCVTFPMYIYAIHITVCILYIFIGRFWLNFKFTYKRTFFFKPVLNRWIFSAQSAKRGTVVTTIAPVIILWPCLLLFFLFWSVGSKYIPAWVLPLPMLLIPLYIATWPLLRGIRIFHSPFKAILWCSFLGSSALLFMFIYRLSVKLYPGSVTHFTWAQVLGVLCAAQACPFLCATLMLCITSGRAKRNKIGYFVIFYGIAMGLLVGFEIYLALVLDGVRDYQWSSVLFPLYCLSFGTMLVKT